MASEPEAKDRLQEELKSLAGRIARLPDLPPPPGLVEAVMARIQPKPRNRWQLWVRRIQTPWTVMPLRALPVAAALLLLAAGLTVWLQGPRQGFSPLPQGQTGLKSIDLVLDWPAAGTVAVIGSFNHWNPDGYRMHRDSPEGPWRLRLELSQGRYAYAFLIDDQWVVPDPHSLLQQDDGFGNLNSALIVENGKSNANQL